MARNSVVILPTSASELNRLMAATEVAFSDGIENFIGKMWSPYECPVEFLPYLAWALSVDLYEDEWPEEVKRDVIAASPIVHRFKGTRFAVERALKALGVTTKIVEWHLAEPVARRGTFEIKVYANKHIVDGEVLLSAGLQKQIQKQVKAVKPKSRFVNLQIGAGYKNKIGVGNAFTGLKIHHQTIEVVRPTHIHIGLGAGNAFTGLQFMHATFSG